MRKMLIGAEQKKIPLLSGVLLSDNDTQPIGLEAFGNQVSAIHAVMVGDAYPVQVPGLSIVQNLIQGESAAGRERGVNVQIEKHRCIFIMP